MPVTKLPIVNMEWVDTSAPSNEEIAAFAREAQLLPADTEFLLEDQQRPEIAVRAEYTLILVHVPIFDKQTRVTSGAPLAFVAIENRLYTLHAQPVVTLEKIRKEIQDHPEKHELAIGDTPISLALYILGQLNISSFRKLKRLAKHIDIAEDAVFFGNERKMVEEIAILGRDVLDFRRIIHPHRHIFEVLPSTLDENTAALWNRVGSQVRQMWELLQSLYDSTKELRNANDSLIQHKENELLRLLSLYSIISIPALVLSGAFNATNVLYETTFWLVLLVLALLLAFIFFRARRRKVL